MTAAASLGGLFLAAFLAATLLPAQSELLLAALVAGAGHPLAVLIAVASAGNVLGSVVNWWIGRSAARLEGRAWFPLDRHRTARAEGWYRRWGRWSLLLSWMPVVGDPLTLVAGLLREPLASFLLLVALAKTGRYLAVAWLAGAFGG